MPLFQGALIVSTWKILPFMETTFQINMETRHHHKEQITPRVFTRVWHMLFASAQKTISNDTALPKIVATLNNEDNLHSIICLVITRVNDDQDFQEMLINSIGFALTFSAELRNEQILVVANRIEAR